MHPGPSGQNSVIRFDIPAAGTWEIKGWFIGNDSHVPTTTDVALLLDSSYYGTTDLFAGDINSYNIPLNFDIKTKLGINERIVFTVGWGKDGNYSSDATGISAVITLCKFLNFIIPYE